MLLHAVVYGRRGSISSSVQGPWSLKLALKQKGWASRAFLGQSTLYVSSIRLLDKIGIEDEWESNGGRIAVESKSNRSCNHRFSDRPGFVSAIFQLQRHMDEQ